jgi:TonB-linked SusC/RagA family outer membrane protein
MKGRAILNPLQWLRPLSILKAFGGFFFLFLFILPDPAIAGWGHFISDNKNGWAIKTEHPVRGKITDNSGKVLAGVSVMVEGTTIGTTTDVNGEYELKSVPDDAGLVFSSVGYNVLKVTVAARVRIDVVLQDNNSRLGDVVVVGYGTQRKVNLTGAIYQVKGTELENRATTNLLGTLQGMVPNLNISYGNRGGEPGSTATFNLRGPGSLSGGSPFVLVDGVPQDMNSVNSDDIESISILKDASASAIYGVRAAYGVILITTKRGKAGKPVISYNNAFSLQKPTTLPDIVSSPQFAKMVNDAFANAGQGVKFPDSIIAKMNQLIAHPGSLPTMVPNAASPLQWDQNQLYGNTNSYDLFYKKLTLNQDHNVSVSGGGNTFNYFLSGGAFDQGSQYKFGDEYYHRYTLTANISAKVTDWMTLGLNSRYIKRKYQMPHVYPLIGDYYHDIPRRWPIWPVLDGNGHEAISTMVLMKYGGRNVNDENELLNSFSTEINPAKGWKINADFNYRQDFNSNNDNAKTVYMYQTDNTPLPQSYSVPNSFTTKSYKASYTSYNIYSSYDLRLDKHAFKLMAGVQSEQSQDETDSLSRSQLITDNVPFITTATGAVTIAGSKGHWGTLGVFGRFNYSYDDKYLLEFSSRYDGTSRFESSRRWGFFPSVSAGYNIAKENFWSPMADKVSLLKVRASYGTLGNQSISGSYYPYLASLGINTNLDWVMGSERPLYVTAPGLVSPDLTWETTTTLNFGLDAEALKHRMSFAFDWYNRKTDDMFGPLQSYPAVLGVNPPRQNNASMETKGFELAVGWNDKIGSIRYRARVLLADNVTTITKYQNASGTLTDYYVGKKYGEIRGYKTAGLFQTAQEVTSSPSQSFIGANWGPGDVHYKDLNGDKKVDKGTNTLSNPGDQAVIGNNTPRYSYGVSLGISWKGFDLDMLWQGVAKRDIWLGGNFLFGDNGNYNQITIFKQHLDYWRPDNTNAYFPKPYMTTLTNKNIQTQTRYLQNASYLRLKNLQLGYTFPTTMTNWLGLGNLRIFFTGENLLTFTPLIKVFDPEDLGGAIGPGKVYPLQTTYSMGLKLNLK